MVLLQKLKKIAGVLLIIAALIMGITAVGIAEWKRPFFSIVFYLMIGLIPFLLGILLLAGIKGFKEGIWGPLRVFTGITVILPLTLQLADYLKERKIQLVSSPNDIYLDSAGIPDWLAWVIIFAGITAFFTFLAMYVAWFKVPKNVYILFSISIILCIFIPLLTKGDFRAIRNDGLVTSVQEEYNEVPWSKMERVFLNGYIEEAIGKSGSDEYVWEFIFYTKEGEKEAFGPFGYSDYNLETSHAIKNKIMAERIPLSTEALSEDEWDFVELDMEFEEEANPKDFYTLFQYNPETKDYYDLPFN